MKILAESRRLSKPTLDGAMEFIWLLLIFTIPLYFNPFALNSFYFVKSLVLVLLVCLMLGLLAAQLILRIHRAPGPDQLLKL